AAHGVAEVDLPVVAGVDVAHRGGHAALGHDGVRLAEQRLGDHACRELLRAALDRGAQAGAAGADDEHVVIDGLDLGCVEGHLDYQVLRSWITPCESRRTYRSATMTQMRLAHANCMWRALNHVACFHEPSATLDLPQLDMQSLRPPTRWRNEW